MPSAIASPSAASGEPGFGRGHRRVGEEPRGHPHRGPADEREHPARARSTPARSPVATNSGTAAATTRPHIAQPAAARPGVEAQDLREVEVGAEREAERGLVESRACAYASGHGNSSTTPTSDGDDREAERAQRQPAADPRSGSRRRTRAAASTKRPSPTGYHARRAARASTAEAAAHAGTVGAACRRASREPATMRSEQERQQREQHQRAEPALRDRVAGDGVDPVREPGGERRARGGR